MEIPSSPVSGPSPTTPEKIQSQLLGQLYELNIPEGDIALVIKAMRGGGTTEEQGQLLPRLYNLSVPGSLISQVIEAMRAVEKSANAAVVSPDNVHESPEEPPPPVYDFKGTRVLEDEP